MVASQPQTQMKNRIEHLIQDLKVSGYRFAKDTEIPINTVYALRNNPDRFPSGDVCDRIIKAYPQIKIQDIVEAEDSSNPEPQIHWIGDYETEKGGVKILFSNNKANPHVLILKTKEQNEPTVMKFEDQGEAVTAYREICFTLGMDRRTAFANSLSFSNKQ